ncbi:MAG: hypothetical protein JST92_27520, partial [Deltaproteobacteria bacterium]|nr:hypothetical protein [Deltaproteobacteria bacterium]
LDDSGQQDTNYIGTVHFTSSDPLAQVPGDYPFAQDDAGEASFVVTFGTAGAQTVTATDTGTGVSTTFTVTLTDPALQALSVSGADDATLGQPFDLVVSTVDSWNSPDSFYTGTVHFTSSDSSATLPPDYTFTAADRGTHVFSGGATLQTTGATITVTDAAAQLSATATPITQ